MKQGFAPHSAASPSQLQAGILTGALAPALLGVACGLAASWWYATVLSPLLFAVQPRDPVTLGSVAFLVLLIVASASWIAAVRASRVSPVDVLHAD